MIKKLLYILILLSSCATVNNPSGGPTDSTPPKVLASNPDSGQLNVQTQEIWLEFDEYVKTNNINELLIISPRLSDRYETSIKKKRLTINFPGDSLQANTTYTVSLNGSIVDINESNALEDYQLFFSTGNTIDSLSYNAVIIDALTKKACEECILSFYTSENDSAILREKPEYLSRTNRSGRVKFEHLPPKKFRAVAIKDENKNLKLDAEEQVSLFKNIQIIDSIIPDTFYVFDYKPIKNYTAKVNRSYPGVIKLSFEDPLTIDSLSLSLDNQSLDYAINKTQDTITSYVDVTTADTFNISLIHCSDTQYLKYIPSPLKSTTFDLRVSRTERASIQLQHAHELDTIYLDRIKLKQDSIYKIIDSITIEKNRAFIYSVLTEASVQLLLDSNSIEDINGSYAKRDSFELKYKEKEGAKLKLILNTSRTEPLLIQLIEGSSVLYEHLSNGSITIDYPMIKSGTYFIRIITDSNNNGRWDGGDLFQNQKAEEVTISEMISLRTNWDKELIINL